VHLEDHCQLINILSSHTIKRIEWQLTLIYQHSQELISPPLLANNLRLFLKPNPNLMFTGCLPISKRRIILLTTLPISLHIILLNSRNYNKINIKADTTIHLILIKNSPIIQIMEVLLLQPSITIFDLHNQSIMKSLKLILPTNQNQIKINLLFLLSLSIRNSRKLHKLLIIVNFRSNPNTLKNISNLGVVMKATS
jgi:hypothetical protein